MTVTDAAALGRAPAYLSSIVALAILFPLSAQAQSGPAIAVVPFVSKTIAYQDLCPEVSISFVARLADELDVQVVVAADHDRAKLQLSITGRIFTLENKPALMARVTHVDSGRAFGAIVSSRDGETLIEMTQRLAKRVSTTITARPDVLSVAPRNVGRREPSAADGVGEPAPHPMQETTSAPQVRTLATGRSAASACTPPQVGGAGSPARRVDAALMPSCQAQPESR